MQNHRLLPLTASRLPEGGRQDLAVETTVPLGMQGRELRIETRVWGADGGVVTMARVVQVHDDALSYHHVLGASFGEGDFRCLLAFEPNAPASVAKIESMHTAAIECLQDIVAQAREHYAVQRIPPR